MVVQGQYKGLNVYLFHFYSSASTNDDPFTDVDPTDDCSRAATQCFGPENEPKLAIFDINGRLKLILWAECLSDVF